ncbi:hypothetical protein [Paenibacillus harenae]|uniref:Uncharacterized protein n=1 Tax=Paenibacillus harenae TaxID=306543 RepID=A0ABT9U6B6_PAEHA|nr:hypothetical protein [Paenibacillus harenae]MDQ0113984.1 hypothetical protein [Paenibacillus harenae]
MVFIFSDRIFSFFVLFFSRDMDRVEKILYKQKHPYYAALLYITKGDYDEANKKVELLKKWGRQKEMRASLKAGLNIEMCDLSAAKKEAEEEFKKGNTEKAEQSGTLAIEASRGLQKYLLYTSLARQRTKPNRESFF